MKKDFYIMPIAYICASAMYIVVAVIGEIVKMKTNQDFLRLVFAPLVEEALKLLLAKWLAKNRNIPYVKAMYFIAITYGVIESFAYIFDARGRSYFINVIVIRYFVTTVMHVVATWANSIIPFSGVLIHSTFNGITSMIGINDLGLSILLIGYTYVCLALCIAIINKRTRRYNLRSL